MIKLLIEYRENVVDSEVGVTDKNVVSRRAALASMAIAVVATRPACSYANELTGAIPLASANEVEFLYIDSTKISVGGKQNIAISLKDYNSIDQASLIIKDISGSAELVVQLLHAVDGAMLFAIDMESVGTFEIAALSFSSAGMLYYIDFSDADASYRSFEVISESPSFRSLDSNEASSTPVDIQLYGSNGDDGISEIDSIESVASALLARSVRSGDLVVALDPGHVGVSYGGGAVGNGLAEQDATWKIAQACKAELEAYKGVKVVYTSTPADRISPDSELKERVNRAVSQNASVLISLHLNSTGTGAGYGAEVWAPYNGGYNSETHAVGVDLGREILAQLERLGLYNRGVRFKWIDSYDPSYVYPDGSKGDYYGIIRHARKSNLPAIIVEHAFLDNWGDYSRFLSDDNKLSELGVADAQGIANSFGLSKTSGTVYRLYYASTYDHHYTMDAKEYRILGTRGWVQEGVAWLSGSKDSGAPVYRLYYPWTLDHHYTMDETEYKILGTRGWTQEGVAWYSDPAQTVPVYRLYHEGTKDHHYTKDKKEYEVLAARGWRQEGIAWYSTQ